MRGCWSAGGGHDRRDSEQLAWPDLASVRYGTRVWVLVREHPLLEVAEQRIRVDLFKLLLGIR